METSPDNNYPSQCIEVGLACDACTSESARQLAAVCKGLRGKMIGQLFVQIYPRSACAPMHSHFADAYRAANSREALESERVDITNDAPGENVFREKPSIPRRGPVPDRRRVMIAVA